MAYDPEYPELGITHTHDTILAAWHRGKLGKIENNQLCDVIDLNVQEFGFVVSEKNRMPFIFVELPYEAKEELETMLNETFDDSIEEKWTLDYTKFSKEFQDELYDKDRKRALKNISKLVKFDSVSDARSYTKKTKVFDDILDAAAWTGGNVTVGSGGTYATHVLLAADLGTFTSNGVATNVSAVTNTSASTLGNNLGGFTMALDGAGFQTVFNSGASIAQFFQLQCTNGCLEIYGHDFQLQTVVTNGSINIAGGLTAELIIRDSDFTCTSASNAASFVRVSNTAATKSMFNIKCFGSNITRLIDLSSSNNLQMGGISAYMTSTGIGIDCKNQAEDMQNCAIFGATSSYLGTASMTTFSKCASDDATASEAGLQNLVATTVFQDLLDLLPVKDEALYGSGVDPVIAARTEYANEVTIIAGDVDIGANGQSRGTVFSNRSQFNGQFNGQLAGQAL